MIALYTLLTTLVVVVIYPFGLILKLLGSTALYSRLNPPAVPGSAGNLRLWIHAASVGEAGIAYSMAGEVKKVYPDSLVFVSTITSTGLERISALNKSQDETYVDYAFLAPIDCPVITNKFVSKIAPTSMIIVETEIWPSLIRSMNSKGVPITVINGKLRRRSFRRYMYLRFAIKKIVRDISLFCVQSRSFSKRFHMLGVPRERIETIGNIKFDSLPEPTDYDRITLRIDFGIPENAHVFVAGSTRPGEEKVLIRSFAMIMDKYPGAFMVIVPRHLKRIAEIENLLEKNGLEYVRRTSGERLENSGRRVLILDTMGELLSMFACADVAFVGGSLMDFSGHNPMEPAALGVPVLFGPYMEQTGSKELLSEGAAALIHDKAELAAKIETLFAHDEKRKQMGSSGKIVVERFKGTLSRTLQSMINRDLI
ncbi:3-deoxy-D-manno-octulosonic acid transferase [Candidatus Latescibacterota bacterium]